MSRGAASTRPRRAPSDPGVSVPAVVLQTLGDGLGPHDAPPSVVLEFLTRTVMRAVALALIDRDALTSCAGLPDLRVAFDGAAPGLWSEQPSDTLPGGVTIDVDCWSKATGLLLAAIPPDAEPVEVMGRFHQELLALTPHADPVSGRTRFAPASDSRRRRSGSFYTPGPLVGHLLRTALDPAIHEAIENTPPSDRERALLDIRVCDPSCGVGHVIVPAAMRLGDALATLRTGGRSPDQSETARARADVLAHCVYAVDLNPTCADLCRTALWLTTRDSEAIPHLRHCVRAGNGVLGATPELLEADAPGTPFSRGTADAWCAAHFVSGPSCRDAAALAAAHGFFHWPAEFPEVFARGGFDTVLGNPPFLNQLATTTAHARGAAELLRRRTGGAVRGYADTAGAFVCVAIEITRPGGRVSLVQPQSFLSTRDAGGVRCFAVDRAALTDLWVSNEHVFDAGVFTCVPSFCVGAEQPAAVACSTNADFRCLDAVAVTPEELRESPTWAHLAPAHSTVLDLEIVPGRTLADIATATADFRDQYYGLAGCIVESDDLIPDQRDDVARFPMLVTSGLIDPAACLWGRRHTRVLKQRWNAPRVDRARLETDGALAVWARERLVPKVLLATQTRVLEAFVDEAGRYLPSVPVITLTPPDSADLWRLAAAVSSPVACVHAIRHYAGAALQVDAIKLAARQTLTLPLPRDDRAWAASADSFRAAQNSADPRERREHLLRFGAESCESHALSAEVTSAVMAWWAPRLGRV